MTTQLHLANLSELTELTERPKSRPVRAHVQRSARTRPRRVASWGEWNLDSRTRNVGRAGVAAARRALEERRDAEALPRAS